MNSNATVALIYIGQAPRPDIANDMRAMLSDRINLMEFGALDGLDAAQIRRLAPGPGESQLITRLVDGSNVKVSDQRISWRMQLCIDDARRLGASLCVIMCTGSFPDLEPSVALLPSDYVFHDMAVFDRSIHTIGLIVPMSTQIEEFEGKYARYGRKIESTYASPYSDIEQLVIAGTSLKDRGADCICLDCVGYTIAHANAVAKATGLTVRIPRIELCKQIINMFYGT